MASDIPTLYSSTSLMTIWLFICILPIMQLRKGIRQLGSSCMWRGLMLRQRVQGTRGAPFPPSVCKPLMPRCFHDLACTMHGAFRTLVVVFVFWKSQLIDGGGLDLCVGRHVLGPASRQSTFPISSSWRHGVLEVYYVFQERHIRYKQRSIL